MTNGKLHVQHKDHDVHDYDNRVIGKNVVAVSTDTGEVRFGDGVSTWRELPSFGGGGDKADSTVEGYDGVGHAGPLHVVVITEADIFETSEVEALEFVPAANEMVMFGDRKLYFGNGVQSLAYLPALTSYDGSDN